MKKIILSRMFGNGLEWYDFALYAFTSLIFSKLFFPYPSTALMATFATFAVGFVARPL